MPIGLNSIELNSFFKLPSLLFGKSIQHTWKFYATFLDNPLRTDRIKDPMPILRSYHFVDIKIPTYEFQQLTVMYGQVPRSTPVLNFEKPLEINITFEEDEFGTIDYFINWMQRAIINKDGYYNAPLKNRIQSLVIEVQDNMGLPIVYYIFHDLYFINADTVTYSYATDDSVKRNITLACDRMSNYYTKYGIISKGQSLAAGAVGGLVGGLI